MSPWLTVVGIGEDGFKGLGKNARRALLGASRIVGGQRQLDLLPVSAFEDIAAGDFDNDGNIDIFLARRNPPGKVAFGRPADILDSALVQTVFDCALEALDHPGGGRVFAPPQPAASLSP